MLICTQRIRSNTIPVLLHLTKEGIHADGIAPPWGQPRKASMRYHRHGYRHEDDTHFVECVEVPDWAYLLRWAAEEVDHKLGHALCGEGPDVWWYNPFRGWLFRRFSWLLFLEDDRGVIVARLDPCPEWVAEALSEVRPWL